MRYFASEAAIKGSAEEYPAIAAFGYAMASVRSYKPLEFYVMASEETEPV